MKIATFFLIFLITIILIPTMTFAGEKEEGIVQFRNHFDFFQPVQSGNDTSLLFVGYHFTAFQCGSRTTFGGFGVGLGRVFYPEQDDRSTLMLKFPVVNVRVAGEYDHPQDEPVLEFGVGTVYDATVSEWGASFLFSLGW